MFFYFVIFFLPLIFYLFEYTTKIKTQNFFYFFYIIILTLFIGLRYEVGGDWIPYYSMFYTQAPSVSLEEWIKINGKSSIFFTITFWIIADYFKNIIFLNLFSGFIFSLGLITFCKHQKNFYVACIVSAPYFVNVFATGYTKQSIAVGFILYMLAFKRNFFTKIFFLFLSIGFHLSSLFFTFSLLLDHNKQKKLREFIFIGIFCLFIPIFFYEDIYNFIRYYFIDDFYSSTGVKQKIFLNLVPSIIFIFFYKKFNNIFYFNTWFLLSLFSIFLFIGIFTIGNFSVVADRLGLYLIPIQIIVFGNLSLLIKKKQINYFSGLVILYYFLIQVIWFNFATFSKYWIPYSMFL